MQSKQNIQSNQRNSVNINPDLLKKHGLLMSLCCQTCQNMYLIEPVLGEQNILENNRCCETCYHKTVDEILSLYGFDEIQPITVRKKRTFWHKTFSQFSRMKSFLREL